MPSSSTVTLPLLSRPSALVTFLPYPLLPSAPCLGPSFGSLPACHSGKVQQGLQGLCHHIKFSLVAYTAHHTRSSTQHTLGSYTSLVLISNISTGLNSKVGQTSALPAVTILNNTLDIRLYSSRSSCCTLSAGAFSFVVQPFILSDAL